MRLAGLVVLLAAAGCRDAPPVLTTADLQGDWALAAEDMEYRIAGWNRPVFTIRGDSVFDPMWPIYARRSPLTPLAWERVEADAWTSWLLDGDTLIHHIGEHDWRKFVRLPTRPSAPRPERIAIRFGGCLGPCPVMDAEIDSSGTFWVLEGDDVVPRGRFVAHGRRDVYDRLSTLAAGLRLDRPHPEVSWSHDALSTLLVAWYDGEPHAFDGTAEDFGPLFIIVAEMANSAWTIPMEETATRHHFASRDALNYRFLSHPEVVREVFGEMGDNPPQPDSVGQFPSRLIAPPSKPLRDVLDQLIR